MTHGMSAVGYAGDIYIEQLEAELAVARRWAAAWRRSAKHERRQHMARHDHNICWVSRYDDVLLKCVLERDSARRVACALYDVMMATAAFAFRDFGDVHEKIEIARRVMAEEARRERGA